MALFGLGKKKKEEKNEPVCCCGGASEEKKESDGGCCCGETTETEGECCCTSSEKSGCCCGEEVDGICCVKVLGAGCKSCHEQYENAKQAVKAMGLSIEVEYVTDMQKVMEYGVMSMPAIVVNEKVVSQGKVLKAAGVEKLLRNFAG